MDPRVSLVDRSRGGSFRIRTPRSCSPLDLLPHTSFSRVVSEGSAFVDPIRSNAFPIPSGPAPRSRTDGSSGRAFSSLAGLLALPSDLTVYLPSFLHHGHFFPSYRISRTSDERVDPSPSLTLTETTRDKGKSISSSLLASFFDASR